MGLGGKKVERKGQIASRASGWAARWAGGLQGCAREEAAEASLLILIIEENHSLERREDGERARFWPANRQA